MLANGSIFERDSEVNKFMLMALGAGSMIAIAAPAAAQTVTGTVNITGSVADKCSVQPGSGNTFGGTVALGELAQADGTMATDLASRFNAPANSAQLNFHVVCNTAKATVAVDATELTTGGGTAAAGYAARIDYAAHVAVSLATPATQTFSNDSRNAASAAAATTDRLANSASNVSITADTFGTANLSDLLVSGSYTGNISIVIAPSA